jgi:hypothetical protein
LWLRSYRRGFVTRFLALAVYPRVYKSPINPAKKNCNNWLVAIEALGK